MDHWGVWVDVLKVLAEDGGELAGAGQVSSTIERDRQEIVYKSGSIEIVECYARVLAEC